MQPNIWFESWFDRAAERGLRPNWLVAAARRRRIGLRRRLGHTLIKLGRAIAADGRRVAVLNEAR